MGIKDAYMAGLSGLRPPAIVRSERTSCPSDPRRVLDLPQGAADYYFRAYQGARHQNSELRRENVELRQALAAARNSAPAMQEIADLRRECAAAQRENSKLRAGEQRALIRVKELEGKSSGSATETLQRRLINHARIALHEDRWHNQPEMAAFAKDRFREIEERVAKGKWTAAF